MNTSDHVMSYTFKGPA